MILDHEIYRRFSREFRGLGDPALFATVCALLLSKVDKRLRERERNLWILEAARLLPDSMACLTKAKLLAKEFEAVGQNLPALPDASTVQGCLAEALHAMPSKKSISYKTIERVLKADKIAH